MRSLPRFTVPLLAVAALALALSVAPAMRADPPLGLRSLSGTFHYTVVSIRQETLPVAATIYCNEYGQIAFDGAGGGRTVAGSGYGVCSDGENPFEPQTFTYTVEASGSVELTDADPGDEPYTTHCQLLERGTLLLCDGTSGVGGLRNPEQLLFQATAVKL